MMNKAGVRRSFLILMIGSILVLHASAQATRIAVIADPSLGGLVDLTTAQLSTISDLSVVERTDLAKIGHERALDAMLSSNDLSPAQFVPADGLVLLRAVMQDGKRGIFARLVAVQPGIVLREVALTQGADPVAQAGEIARDFSPYWAKLAQIQRGKVTALSLLGLRFELDSEKNRETERRINVLLASRLSAESDIVVLERWKMNDVLFDKSLNAQAATPFWTGSSLVDGSMKMDGGKIAVSLRVQPPNGTAVSIRDEESPDNLAALVERLAGKIQTHPTTQVSWQPAAEAQHYAELGKWCLDNRLTDQGAEAIESALALGDGSPATHRLQVRAYKSLTFTDELPGATSLYSPYAPVMNPLTLPDRMKWGTTAADLAGRYVSANANFSGQPGALDDPVALSLPVLDNCLRLLLFAYAEGYAWDHPDETADLRHKVQGLMSQLEPMLAQRPSDQRDLFLNYQIRYAPFWHESPEATVAYYRDLLNRKTDGVRIRKAFGFGEPSVFLPLKQERAEHPDNPLPVDWYSGLPRIISWDDRPSSELTEVWQNFENELSASSDVVLRADALKLGGKRSNTWADLDNQWANGDAKDSQILAFLQQNRDSLVGDRGNEILTGLQWHNNEVSGPYRSPNLDALRTFGAELLNERIVLPSDWFRRMPMIYRDVPPNVARALMARLDAYRQWYQTQVPQDPELVLALEQARRPLAALANAASQETGNHFVTVDRRWPMQGFGADLMRTSIFSPSFITAENKAWFVMFGGKLIHCIDPANLHSDAVFTIPGEYVTQVEHTPGGVCLGVTPQYLVVCIYGKVLLCSRTDNTWRQLDLPPSDYKPYWINQQLYLIYDVESDMIDARAKDEGPGTAISGLVRVSLPDGGIENLVSTRRIPPQSPLDGKPLGFPLGLWDSPAGLMLAVHAEAPPFQIFGASPGTNDWALAASDPLKCDVKPGTGGQLIGKGFDQHGFAQLVLMNGKDSEVLLSNPSRAAAGNGTAARWELPDEVRAIPADVYWQAGAVMRGNDLCFYRNVLKATSDGFQACLYYYAKGQKTAVKIPLKFVPPANENVALSRGESAVLNFQSLHATDYGLVISQAVGGFWVIPWSDIDAFRATATADVATVSPAPIEPSAVVAVPVPVAPPPAPAPKVVVITPPAQALPVPAAVPPPAPAKAKITSPVTPPVLAPAPAPAQPARQSNWD